MKAIRWSGDRDRYFGPMTFSKDEHFRQIAVMLGSGDGDDYPGCRLRLSAAGWTVILALPQILKPWRRWVDLSSREWSKPPHGYWDTGEREYGFEITGGHLSIGLGRVTNDSSTEQRWGYFLPWTQWRHVRHSYYHPTGEHYWTEPENRWRSDTMEADERMREGVPSMSFEFLDFDGEALTATAQIEEREWRFGEGWFKWLSFFRRPCIKRSLDLRFSGETGERKGSWKGGTIGHGIEMLPGETPDLAFRRYCAENSMTFVA